MKLKTIGLLVLGGLVGCTVGPDYHKPEQKLPDHWQSVTHALQTKPIDDLKSWWKSFGDTALNKLMAQALAGNLDIKIALARIDQARAERRGTRAELLPTVNAISGVQRQNNPFPGLAPGIKYNMFELGFDAIWEVDLFGRQQRRLESSTAELEAAGEEYRQSLVILCAELARTYTDYRSLQSQLAITRANLVAQQHTLALTERMFHEGVSARHDVIRARAQVEKTAAQIPALEADLFASLRQLELLVGRQPGILSAELNKVVALPNMPAQKILGSPAQVINNRPDIHVAERRLAAATAMQGAATAELFPKISLSAFIGLRNTDIESLFKSAAFSYGTAANLVQPLLNFGRIKAGINLAKAKQKEAYWTYEKTVLQALQETETAITRYLKEEIRRQALARSVADLNESVRLSQLCYKEGVASFLEVLDAQRELYGAQIDLARSQAAATTNLIALYKALGGDENARL
jgi:NodT family efflux transporter outer membrane factor (OMF) lipoprotein